MSASKEEGETGQLWFLSWFGVSFFTVQLLVIVRRSGVWILGEDRVIYGLSV